MPGTAPPRRCGQGEEAKGFSFFAVGVDQARHGGARRISVRAPLKLAGLRFADLFAWLSSSLSNLSRSRTSQPRDPPAAGMGASADAALAVASGDGFVDRQSHVAAAQPCQDAHFHLEAKDADGRPVIVLDGRGRRRHGRARGVGATLACDTFGRLVEAYIGKGGRVEQIERQLVERWITGLVYRIELDAKRAGASARRTYPAPCWQPWSETGARCSCRSVTAPSLSRTGRLEARLLAAARRIRQHHQLRHLGAHRARRWSSRRLDEAGQEVALFTDGIENLVLQKAKKAVHAPFFDSMFPPVRKSTGVGRRCGLSRALDELSVEPAVNEPHRRRQDTDPGLAAAGVGCRPCAAAGGGGEQRHAGPPRPQARPGRRGRDLRARGPARPRRQDLPSAAAGAARGEDPGDGGLAHAGARQADGLADRAAVAAGRPADRR